MDWPNEKWVKLYTRDTDDHLVLSWQARAVWHEMIRKFDRSGLIEMKRGRRGLAALIRIPLEVVDAAIPELVEDGRLRELPNGYFAPNFMEAQEATSSNSQRQRESRERRRAKANATVTLSEPAVTEDATVVTNRDEPPCGLVTDHGEVVTKRDTPVTKRDQQEVTRDEHPPTGHSTPSGCHSRLEETRRERGEQVTPAPSPSGFTVKGLADSTWRRVSDMRVIIARELGLENVHPFPDIGPAYHPLSYRDLCDRIREEGANAPAVVETVLAVLEAQARKERSIEWLAEKAFGEKAWRRAKESAPKWLGKTSRPTRPANDYDDEPDLTHSLLTLLEAAEAS